MDLDSRGIPYRKTNDGQLVMETRPHIIEEWLDTLPYADFNKTCKLILEAVQSTNQETMKYTQRLELVALYDQPYEYFIESQLDIRTSHTRKSIISLQSNLADLRELSLAMGVACRISVDEALNRKTLWIQTKPPIDAILTSLKYFSEALVCCFIQYYPTPKTIWRELNFLYDFAESIGKHETEVNFIGDTDASKRHNVSNLYKCVVLTSLVDPYHLPFGAIWEIYLALMEWAEKTEIIDYKHVKDDTSLMVLPIKKDLRPVPFTKFNKKLAKNEDLRLLYVGSLVNMLKTKLNALKSSGAETTSIPLAPQYAEHVLAKLINNLETPTKRNFPRVKKNLMIRVAHGFSDCYFYINGEEEFHASPVERTDENAIVEIVNSEYTPSHSIELWELQDYSQGGYAIRRELKKENTLRVGEIVAVYTGKNNIYNLAVVSWLMIRTGNMYHAGLEVLARDVMPGKIRQGVRGEYSKVFVSGEMDLDTASIIAEDAICNINENYELCIGNEKLQIQTKELLFSNTSVNQYSISQAV